MLAVLILACSGKGDDTNSAETDADTDADTDTDTDTDTDDCAVVNSGKEWAWNGTCAGMYTPCDIVVKGCDLTIDYAADGGMTMGMPYTAHVSGKTVTFADDNAIDGCVGDVKDADHIEGTCKDEGCAFVLYQSVE